MCIVARHIINIKSFTVQILIRIWVWIGPLYLRLSSILWSFIQDIKIRSRFTKVGYGLHSSNFWHCKRRIVANNSTISDKLWRLYGSEVFSNWMFNNIQLTSVVSEQINGKILKSANLSLIWCVMLRFSALLVTASYRAHLHIPCLGPLLSSK